MKTLLLLLAAAIVLQVALADTCGRGRVGDGDCRNSKLCCSRSGWCGRSPFHCGLGCHGGPCFLKPVTTTTKAPTTTTKAPTTTTKAPTTTTKAPTTTTKAPTTTTTTTAAPQPGTCGNGVVGNGNCANSSECCSQWGWCDNTPDHCSAGCHGGPCTAPTTTTTTTSGPTTPPASSCPIAQNCFANPTGPCGRCLAAIVNSCVNPNHIAMTFDDGPTSTNGLTARVLDELKNRGIKTTFFVLGVQIDASSQHADLLRRAYNEGHQIALHSYDHSEPTFDSRSESNIRDQITRGLTSIRNVLGVTPQYFRPPFFGCTTPACLNTVASMGLQSVFANVDPWDWNLSDPVVQPSDIVDRTREGHTEYAGGPKVLGVAQLPAGQGIVQLLHDIQSNTANRLPAMLDYLQTLGKQFVRLDQCLGHNPVAYRV